VSLGSQLLETSPVERPVGSYEVTAFHERFGNETKSVTIRNGETTAIELDVVGDTPWIGDYTNDDWFVDAQGMKDAIDDWKSDRIEEVLFHRVADAWTSGDPVY